KDGSAEMVLGVLERNFGRWGRLCPPGPFPYGPGRVTNQCDAFHFWSLHPGGANFLFADGSVQFLSYSAASIMAPLATRAGGESVSASVNCPLAIHRAPHPTGGHPCPRACSSCCP